MFDIYMIMSLVVSVAVVVAILSPFVLNKPENLESAFAENSIEVLEGQKRAILKRYLEEERLYENAELSERVWNKRRLYFVGRYVDLSKRADTLEGEGS